MTTILRDFLASTPGAGVAEGLIEATASQIPYGADSQVLTYYGATNNVHTVAYSRKGVLVKTRTYTYAAGGVANDDLVTSTVDA